MLMSSLLFYSSHMIIVEESRDNAEPE